MTVFMILVLTFTLIGMLMLMYNFGKSYPDSDGTLLFSLTFAFFVASLLYLSTETYKTGHNDGYKEGQVDAIKGNIKYELESVEVDSIETWTKKDNGE